VFSIRKKKKEEVRARHALVRAGDIDVGFVVDNNPETFAYFNEDCSFREIETFVDI
jgi:hypothetical protein